MALPTAQNVFIILACLLSLTHADDDGFSMMGWGNGFGGFGGGGDSSEGGGGGGNYYWNKGTGYNYYPSAHQSYGYNTGYNGYNNYNNGANKVANHYGYQGYQYPNKNSFGYNYNMNPYSYYSVGGYGGTGGDSSGEDGGMGGGGGYNTAWTGNSLLTGNMGFGKMGGDSSAEGGNGNARWNNWVFPQAATGGDSSGENAGNGWIGGLAAGGGDSSEENHGAGKNWILPVHKGGDSSEESEGGTNIFPALGGLGQEDSSEEHGGNNIFAGFGKGDGDDSSEENGGNNNHVMSLLGNGDDGDSSSEEHGGNALLTGLSNLLKRLRGGGGSSDGGNSGGFQLTFGNGGGSSSGGTSSGGAGGGGSNSGGGGGSNGGDGGDFPFPVPTIRPAPATKKPEPSCKMPIDIMVVAEDSTSIGQTGLTLMQRALLRLVDDMDISDVNVHMGFVTYSNQVDTVLDLNDNPLAVKAAINGIGLHQTQGANIGAAINKVVDVFNRKGRTGVPQIGIVLTNSKSGSTTATQQAANRARQAGIHMVSVGVGLSYSMADLTAIANDIFDIATLETFEELTPILIGLNQKLCCKPTPTPLRTWTPWQVTKRTTPPRTPTLPTVLPDTPQKTTSPPRTNPPTTRRVWTTRPPTRRPVTKPTTQKVTTPMSPPTRPTSPPTRPTTRPPTTTSTSTTTTTTTTTTQRPTTTRRKTTKKTTRPPTIRPATTPSTPRKPPTTPLRTTPKRTPPTTTTTTPRPISTTTKPPVPDICDGCAMRNGVGFKSHWSDCSKFIQCTFNPDGSTTVYIKTCSHGTFWDQDKLTCNHPHLVNCSNDPCDKPGYTEYKSDTTCGGYWECKGGVSKGVCCKPKHRYDVIKGCVPDPTCLDDCGEEVIEETCDKRPVLNKPLMFEQFAPGMGWVLQSCPPGTAFSLLQCVCVLATGPSRPLPKPECKPELYIPFTGGIRDESGNNNYIQVEGVKVVDNTGYFNGKSLLRVPRFSNLAVGDTVIIKLRYRQEGGTAGTPQALIANGDCYKPSSMYMVSDGGNVDVGIRTNGGKDFSVTMTSTGTGWKEVVMVVDKQTLLGSVNGISYQTLFTGDILTSKCALQIGRGTDFKHFTGYMDDITVYLCKPKDF